LNSFLIYKYW